MANSDPQVLRYVAFSRTTQGGNPAGVVLSGGALDAPAMQAIATQVGYSETAFITDPISDSEAAMRVRYFAPEGEVSFCGHATIATAAALGEHIGFGVYTLMTGAGPVQVTAHREAGMTMGSFVSPPISCTSLSPEQVQELLTIFHWSVADLDPAFTPALGFGGEHHPVIVLRSLSTLSAMKYDFGALQRLCRERRWITIQIVCRLGDRMWRSRNPFAWGGVVEDPATGAAAAAFAGYLTACGELKTGEQITVEQGVELGRPSQLVVTLRGDTAQVGGPALRLHE